MLIKKKSPTKWYKTYGAWLTGLSAVGIVATFWPTIEKMALLEDPDKTLSCSINPIVDCGTVLNHDLSAVFGVPNSMLGLVVFSMLAAIGGALLMKVKPTTALQRAVMIVIAFMFSFGVWFFAASLYVIGKICIFCIGVWLVTIPLLVLTLREYDAAIFTNKQSLRQFRTWVQNRPEAPILLLYLIAILLFLYRFRDYYFG